MLHPPVRAGRVPPQRPGPISTPTPLPPLPRAGMDSRPGGCLSPVDQGLGLVSSSVQGRAWSAGLGRGRGCMDTVPLPAPTQGPGGSELPGDREERPEDK